MPNPQPERQPDSSEGRWRMTIPISQCKVCDVGRPPTETPDTSCGHDRETHAVTKSIEVMPVAEHQALLDQERARVGELEQKLADARYTGDNHHNAAACPYCRPELEGEREKLRQAESQRDALRARLEEANRALEIIAAADPDWRTESLDLDWAREVARSALTTASDTDQEGDADEGSSVAVPGPTRVDDGAGVDDGSGPRACNCPTCGAPAIEQGPGVGKSVRLPDDATYTYAPHGNRPERSKETGT